MPDYCCTEQLYVFYPSVIKASPHLVQLFRRILQQCFAVKLQKCFVNIVSTDTIPLWVTLCFDK